MKMTLTNSNVVSIYSSDTPTNILLLQDKTNYDARKAFPNHLSYHRANGLKVLPRFVFSSSCLRPAHFVIN